MEVKDVIGFMGVSLSFVSYKTFTKSKEVVYT